MNDEHGPTPQQPPEPSTPTQPDTRNDEGRHAFSFTGTGAEYFGIWIVNNFLSLITLGIYSPWATVRNRRYFYGNTLLAGHVFDFHGSPVAILKGRLIALILLLAIYSGDLIHIVVSRVVFLVVVAAFPWILVKTLRFRLSNTSYRSLRFGYEVGLATVYKRLFPLVVVAVATFVTLSHFFVLTIY